MQGIMRLPRPDKIRSRNDIIRDCHVPKAVLAMTEGGIKTKINTKDGFPLSRE